MGWKLNETKNMQFANNSEVRSWLRSAVLALQASTSFRDLGVVAATGPKRRCAVSSARLRAAVGRFARVRLIPATFRWRCSLGAAAGTACGIYGAACGRPPCLELEQLRRAARIAVW